MEGEITDGVATHQGERFGFRLAGEADDAALRQLLRETPMDGPVRVTLRREPSYFGRRRGRTLSSDLGCDRRSKPTRGRHGLPEHPSAICRWPGHTGGLPVGSENPAGAPPRNRVGPRLPGDATIARGWCNTLLSDDYRGRKSASSGGADGQTCRSAHLLSPGKVLHVRDSAARRRTIGAATMWRSAHCTQRIPQLIDFLQRNGQFEAVSSLLHSR